MGSYSSLGNRGSPHDVAAAVTWPASSTASYTTGAVLIVDGGKGARRLSRLSADP
ncbi:MAG TPA: SDR family oxidoreductase, partial [Jiangellaceae bacterium]|nr:SDR family oxidoreductase [Jiangellaceae bacterium]